MPSVKRLIAAGAISFVIGLLLLFPARVAYQWFAPAALTLSGIEGSIWRGASRHARAGGVYLRELEWRAHPLTLFTGRLGADLSAKPVGGFVETSAKVSPDGDVELSNLRASVPLGLLETATNIRGLAGMLSAQFERIELSDGAPVAADGTVDVADLLVPLVARIPIGGFRAEFFTQEDGIVASVEDTNGLVDLAGRLLVRPDRSYQFLGQLAPKAETPPAVRQQMAFLGTPNARGQYELRLEGVL